MNRAQNIPVPEDMLTREGLNTDTLNQLDFTPGTYEQSRVAAPNRKQ